jgi:hypothetical protein
MIKKLRAKLCGFLSPRHGSYSGWRKLHNEELRNLYASPNIITVVKSRRMRLAGPVARMGEMKNAYRVLVGKPEGKSHSENLGTDGNIILEWILGKSGGKLWTRYTWLRVGTRGGPL